MPNPFDFEAFIAGTNLPRFEVPLYGVVHQHRIDELDAEIKAARDVEGGDERESSVSPVVTLTEERDRLEAEQEASASWVELRSLSGEEYEAVPNGEDSLLDQIAAQSQGTRNPLDRERWAKVKAKAPAGSWFLFASRANEIVRQSLVVPDFSLNSSKTNPSSSAS
jgi:hypothetical protein